MCNLTFRGAVVKEVNAKEKRAEAGAGLKDNSDLKWRKLSQMFFINGTVQ